MKINILQLLQEIKINILLVLQEIKIGNKYFIGPIFYNNCNNNFIKNLWWKFQTHLSRSEWQLAVGRSA